MSCRKRLSARTRCFRPSSSVRHSRGRNDARNDVERDQPFGAAIFAVNGESDADAVERALGFIAFLGDLCGGRALQPVGKTLVVGPDGGVGAAHFIVIDTGHEVINVDLWLFSKT